MWVTDEDRLGMLPEDFMELAALFAAVVREDARVASEVSRLRHRFLEMRCCFTEEDYAEPAAQLRATLY